MDDYLATLGLWRKPTARDKTCLFRAVSEQIFHSQALYPRVKKVCDDYIERNRTQLEEECKLHGQLDIVALSKLFRRECVIYREPGKPPVNLACKGYENKVVLCFSGGHHYDTIYPRGYIQTAALCQSVVYEILYNSVFKLESPVETSAEMIGPNKPRGVTVSTSPDSVFGSMRKSCTEDIMKEDFKVLPAHKSTVPFPYKVAKALAPDIYRNVELDVWIEAKKEQCATGACADDDEPIFSPGDKCRILLDGRLLNAHIQEIEPEHGPTTVFVEELGEKHIVPITSLKPLMQNNKGWNQSEDGQAAFRKRKQKPVRAPIMSSSTEAGPTSPLVYKPEFGSQHVINAAGHQVKNSGGFPMRMRHHSGGSTGSTAGGSGGGSLQHSFYPGNQYNTVQLPRGQQRVRSYSESGATNGVVIHAADDYGKAGSPHCRGAENSCDNSSRRVPYTPPPPRPESYGTAYPQLCAANGSPMLPPPVLPSQPQLQPPLVTLGASSAGPQQMHAPYSMRCPTNNDMLNGSPSPGHQQFQTSYPMRCPVNNGMNVGLPNATQEPFPVGAHVPYFPYLVIPHVDTIIGPVNYRVPPSCDSRGVDLPMHDPSTLRFFFNLGVEYYRLCACINQPSVSHPQQMAAPGIYAAGGDMRYTVPSGYVPQMAPPMMTRPHIEADYSGQFESDKSLVKDKKNEVQSLNHKVISPIQPSNLTDEKNLKTPTSQTENQTSGETTNKDHSQAINIATDPASERLPGVLEPDVEQIIGENKNDESTDSSECPSEDSDKNGLHDSGCVSDASSGNGEVTLPSVVSDRTPSGTQIISPRTADSTTDAEGTMMPPLNCTDLYSDDDILELLRQPVFTRAPRNKPNKKNGPTKLVRPIKDIPPRFKKLLETEAVTQAAAMRKNQFEGAPLVRQIMMGRGKRHRNTDNMITAHTDFSQANFNPNAQSFIPGQPYPCRYEDNSDNGVGYVTLDGNNSVVEGCSSTQYVTTNAGNGPVDGAPTYAVHVVNGAHNSACSSEAYYCECPSNSVCVSSSGTYYSSQQTQAAPGVGVQNTTYYAAY